MRSAQAFLFAALLLTSCDSDDDEPAQPSGGGNTSTCTGTTVTDIDGNVYPVVQIGSQCWMASNLRTTHYRDGNIIPNVTDNTTWVQLSTGASCSYNNNSTTDITYGRLYNWYAASNPNLCPLGWHVPTDAEWTFLTDHLGGSIGAGGKLKATGTIEDGTGLWYAPNTSATNQSGFSALPSGGRNETSGEFAARGYVEGWWSASENSIEDAWFRLVSSGHADVIGDSPIYKTGGACVRCLRD